MKRPRPCPRPICCRSTARCSRSGAWKKPRPRPIRRARSAASSTSIIGQEAVCVGAIATLEPRRLRRRDLPRARSRLRQGRAGARHPGRALRQEDRGGEGPRRLDAHVRQGARNFLGGYGIVGGHVPIAAGAGVRRRSTAATAGVDPVLLRRGRDAPSAGSTRASRWPALWKLPVVFICENNQYSMGTPLYRSLAVEDVSMRALAHGMARDRFDGDDVSRSSAGSRTRSTARARPASRRWSRS